MVMKAPGTRSKRALAIVPLVALLIGASPVAAQEQPVAFVDPEFTDAIRDAIATWSAVLEEEFPTVSLTDVTDTARNPHRADIVVHYVPHAGGIQWGGYAQCGDHRCNNVIVRSDVPDL